MKLQLPQIRTLPGSFQYPIAFLTTLSIVLLSAFWILSEYQNFEEDIQKQKEEYIQDQKQLVRHETEKIVEYINISRKFMMADLKEKLQYRVHQAHNIADNLYLKNRDKMSSENILTLIIEALRPIRYNNDRGHFFIMNTRGDELLYPLYPEKEGSNYLFLRDSKEKLVVQEQIQVAKIQKEGFVEGHWSRPDSPENTPTKSITFVKYFAPLNIIIGSGEFLDDVEKDLQEQIIKHIQQVQYGEDGYIFLNTYEGQAIIISSDKYKRGDNIWDITDPNGVKVVQEERKAVENPEGDFITYHWMEPNNPNPVPKISFIKGIPEWQWMLGAWYNMNQMDANIIQQRETLQKRVNKKILQMLVILLITHFLIFIVTKRIANSTKRNSKTFIQLLEEAIRNNLKIDVNKLQFLEFRRMAEAANLAVEEKDEALQAMKISEDRFRNLFEIAPMMICGFNAEKQVILWNKECEKRLGTTKEDIIKKDNPIHLLFRNEKSFSLLEQNLFNPDRNFQEYSLTTTNGKNHQQVWTSFRSTQELIIAVGYDITQQKEIMDNLQRTAKQLKEANQTKDKFLSIIAHDLKNPFNALLGFSALLKDEYDELSDELRKDYIREMHRSAENTLVLLENLLEWARSQSDRIDYSPQLHSLYETAENCRLLLGAQAAKKHITIENKIEHPCLVFADQNMILTVIRNLVSNAIKFTNEKGQVQIEQISNGKDIILSIKDNGVGMSSKVLENLFKIDKKHHTLGTHHETGSGLGLLICKEFIEKNGGKIWAESEKGVGSCFYIKLPINNNNNSNSYPTGSTDTKNIC
jgi:PAS domain S-box-containing protein